MSLFTVPGFIVSLVGIKKKDRGKKRYKRRERSRTRKKEREEEGVKSCLLYTSDAADDIGQV